MASMTRIAAGRFKDQCLKILDSVAQTRHPVVVTKRGRPVATIVPYFGPRKPAASLVGSILREHGDPFGTSQDWDADRS
ncbi:MAG: type II toxin-antitoxin system Phd/YefM family antitoxin [Acidobacteria bacterium]|nr:type II toxin-antitoxin system Phd/YefM family antitoxin [Acidobacteriota bacterium]